MLNKILPKIQNNPQWTFSNKSKQSPSAAQIPNAKIPLGTFQAIYNISFTSNSPPVQDIELKEYLKLSEAQKAIFRQKCDSFNEIVIPKELFQPQDNYLPLSGAGEVEEFVNFSKNYNKLKGSEIICLGRSPKWSLNTSKWMQDGIEDYKFVAFSKSWYKRIIDNVSGDRYLVKDPALAPSVEQEAAYRKYLDAIKANPKKIVEAAQKTGKEVVITDYVETSKGFTSFLDLMSRYAKEQGVLQDFAKSIMFFKIGSNEYTEDKIYFDDQPMTNRRVILPETLREVIPATLWNEPYPKQEYYDMSENILEQMILNKNANECRSDFYPKEKWLITSPLKKQGVFPRGMKNLRNLLNFRVLDYLNAKDLIRRY